MLLRDWSSSQGREWMVEAVEWSNKQKKDPKLMTFTCVRVNINTEAISFKSGSKSPNTRLQVVLQDL